MRRRTRSESFPTTVGDDCGGIGNEMGLMCFGNDNLALFNKRTQDSRKYPGYVSVVTGSRAWNNDFYLSKAVMAATTVRRAIDAKGNSK
jgi:hypothetical protein